MVKQVVLALVAECSRSPSARGGWSLKRATPRFSEFPQQAANAALIHADLLKRLKQRVIRNRVLLTFGAFCPRLAEVGSFVENDDVAALSTLQKQVFRIGLSPAK